MRRDIERRRTKKDDKISASSTAVGQDIGEWRGLRGTRVASTNPWMYHTYVFVAASTARMACVYYVHTYMREHPVFVLTAASSPNSLSEVCGLNVD